MTAQKILVLAPSNIALIKYMGKQDAALNLPANPSLSMTLEGLCTYVQVERTAAPTFNWKWSNTPLVRVGSQDLIVPQVDERFLKKIQAHLKRVRAYAEAQFASFELELSSPQGLSVSSGNTFPHSAGIASSASAFAALTLAFAAALCQDVKKFEAVYLKNPALKTALSRLSRQGSGSSIRSFDGPWVCWDQEDAAVVPFAPVFNDWIDLVVIVSREQKTISSSKAHQQILGSPLWTGRPARAKARVEELKKALSLGDVQKARELTWADHWEMHSLFHTAQPPFSYWKPGTLQLLNAWMEQDEVLITLDAGPNVHLLMPSHLEAKWRQKIKDLAPDAEVLIGRAGQGARIENRI